MNSLAGISLGKEAKKSFRCTIIMSFLATITRSLKFLLTYLFMNLAGLWDRIASAALHLACSMAGTADWRTCG